MEYIQLKTHSVVFLNMSSHVLIYVLAGGAVGSIAASQLQCLILKFGYCLCGVSSGFSGFIPKK